MVMLADGFELGLNVGEFAGIINGTALHFLL